MAVVVLMRLVMGSASFLPRRFSSGASAPKSFTVLISVQLLHWPEVSSL